jgi:hypothetical protein
MREENERRTEYYHDEESMTVYAVPSRPNVIEKRYGWEIQVVWEVTRADNFIDPRTGRLKYPCSVLVKDFYDNCKDTEDRAVQWFKLQNYPPGRRIDVAEYAKLKQVYDKRRRPSGSNQSSSGARGNPLGV